MTAWHGGVTAACLLLATLPPAAGASVAARDRPHSTAAAVPADTGPHSTVGAMPPSPPSYEEVRARHTPSDLVVLDRHGVPAAALRMDASERRGAWMPLNAISPALRAAVLLSEDRRFHEHGGVDWLAVAAAGWNVVTGDGARGASTISMQLAAMLNGSLQRPKGGRSVGQKLDQARQAWRLEAAWTKHQILEAYLNLAAFRGELRGVDAMSRVMFGKHPHALDARESAVAAALLRGPNAAPDRVTARACALLHATEQSGDCSGLSQAVQGWMLATARPAVDTPALAPHFARVLASRAPRHEGGTLESTLDASLQRLAVQTVRRHLAGMANAQLTDAAVVVLDNDSGEVLAYVGSSGDASSAAQVDHARARRQAGSTLKPFLYAQALEARYLTAASLLDDAPLDVGTANGLYIPRNYDGGHAGLVSVRTALAASLNIPAVRTLMLVGPEPFADRLRRIGLPLEEDGDHYGYSLSLGSAGVDLLSLTNAYRALARGGSVSEPRMTPGAATPVAQVFTAQASWLVGDILSDRGARARTFGLENALATRFWSAVKTGTSKDMRDNWCLGWSARHTVGVWVGNSHGLSMRDVSGITGAAPIWQELMQALHERTPGGPPPPPAGIEPRHVVFADWLEPARREFFLPGTAVDRVEPAHAGAARPRIASPSSNTVIALDPDMPEHSQRLALKASSGSGAAGAGVRWSIDGTIIGTGESVWWRPSVGWHRIVLRGRDGAALDEVMVQVRGLPRLAKSP